LPYVSSIPNIELEGYSLPDSWRIDPIYQSADKHFQHLLILTETANVYLVVIIDLRKNEIYGHRILNLNLEYGLE